MTKDNAASEIVAVLLLISIAVLVIGIIAVFFYSNINVQQVPEVDLSFSSNEDDGTVLIYSQRGESLSYDNTQFRIGTSTIPKDEIKSFLSILKKDTTDWVLWRDTPQEVFSIGDRLRWSAPDSNVEDVSIDIIHQLPGGDGILIDKIGYQSAGSGGGASGGGVRLSSPNGGERWTGGTLHSIIWTSYNINAVSYTLEYSSDNGVIWNYITEVPGDRSSYQWSVPSIDTTQALVKVTANLNDGTSKSDTSDNVFTILLSACSTPVHALFSTSSPLITLQNTLDVTFTDQSTSDDPVIDPIRTRVWNFGDGTPPFQGMEGGTYSHPYTEGEYYARLTVDNGCDTDTGSVYISVGNPSTPTSSVSVTSPNGGEIWAV